MRFIATIFLSLSILFANAGKIWVNSGNGVSGAGTYANPYQSGYTAINAAASGDSVLFLDGTINYFGSGATGGTYIVGSKTIYIGRYASGVSTAKPIWTGLKTISSGSLTNMGGGYYSYTDSDFTTYLHSFVFDGKQKQIMRDEASLSNPYRTITATDGFSYIIDTSLTGSEDYVGRQIVYRGIQWNIEKGRVTAQHGDTLFYTSLSGQKSTFGYPTKAGWGYFIQNLPNEGKAAGEWMFDSANKKLIIYIPDGDPSAHVLQVPIRSIAINSDAAITVEGIDFRGFLLGAYTGGANNVTWKSCDFSLMGVYSHYVTDRSGHEFYDCNFYDCQNTTIKATSNDFVGAYGPPRGNNNWKIINCVFQRIGTIGEGMGYGNGDPMLDGFYLSGYNTLIQNCSVDSTGYNGYHIQSTGFTAEYCYGANTNKYLSDGAVFYNFYGSGVKPTSPAKSYIRYCTFLNGIGNAQGVNAGTFDPTNDNGKAGNIYMDENSSNVDIINSNLAYAAWANVILNGTHDITVRNTPMFGAWRNLYIADFNPTATYAANNNRFVSNVCSQNGYSTGFPSAPGNMVMDFHNLIKRTPSTILFADSNKYNTFFSVTGNLFYLQYLSSPYKELKTAAQWRTYLGSETNSTFIKRNSHKFLYNHSADTVYQSVTGSWTNASTGATETGSVKVAPYGSVILVDSTAGGNLAPTASAGSAVSITYPTVSTTLTGSGSDADGSISSYAWTIESGTGGSLSSPSTATTNFTGTPGVTYVLKLTVTDNSGATGTDRVTVNVNKLSQSITFSALTDKTYGDSPFSLSASASSGLSVSYTSSNTSVATVSGSTVTIVGAGTTTITAYQSGNSNYNAATEVSRTLTVLKANQTINFTAISGKQDSDPPFTISATATSGLAVTFNLLYGPATLSGNTVTLTGAAGTVLIEAVQDGNGNYNAASKVQQSFAVASTPPAKSNQTISFPAIANKILGDSAFTISATASSGLPVTFTVISGPATIAGSTVTLTGTGTVTIQATQAGNGSYNSAAAVNNSFVVSARPVTPPVPGTTTGKAIITVINGQTYQLVTTKDGQVWLLVSQ